MCIRDSISAARSRTCTQLAILSCVGSRSGKGQPFAAIALTLRPCPLRSAAWPRTSSRCSATSGARSSAK
eukprot:11276496-Alexandrium_andersonii.AAC.1